YVLKFDPSTPEKNSGAERISTLVLHAAGYNVPHNTIVSFRSSDLVLAEDAYHTDVVGKRRPLTRGDLEAVLKKIKPLSNGPYRVGHEYIFDGGAMSRSLVTFGLWHRPWEEHGRIVHPEIGYYDSELFEPERWKPNYPNPAFNRMDEADGYWGAKIVTAFSDEVIEKLARAGEYSRSEVTTYLADTIKRLRDAIDRYWLDRVDPLE